MAQKTPRSKRAVKIMRSLGNHVPMRLITDKTYIREKHHELNPEVLKRDIHSVIDPTVVACHTTADEGIYER